MGDASILQSCDGGCIHSSAVFLDSATTNETQKDCIATTYNTSAKFKYKQKSYFEQFYSLRGENAMRINP